VEAFEQGRLAVAALAGGGVLSAMGIYRLRRRWLIENLPTSRVRSAAMGMVELKGKARAPGKPAVAILALMEGSSGRVPPTGGKMAWPGGPEGSAVAVPAEGERGEAPVPFSLRSPVRGLPCVWCRVRVTRIVQRDRRTEEQVVLDREQGAPFMLEDETGRMLVLPAGAEVKGVPTCDVSFGGGAEPPPDVRLFCDMNGVAWRGMFSGRHRVKEWALLLDADTYVLGDLGKLGDEAGRRRAGILRRLKGMLASPEERARLDANKDGTIDQLEWDAARREAEEAEIRKDLESPDDAPRTAVRKPARGIFIIASGSEADALKAMGYPWFLIVGGVLAMLLGVWFFPPGAAKAPLVLVPAGASVAAAAFSFARSWKRRA
jgi:hypothetical protein